MARTKRARSLAVVPGAVHPFGISRRAGNPISFAQPLEQVAVLATPAAEGRVLRRLRLAAQRAFLRFVRRFRHTRPTWG